MATAKKAAQTKAAKAAPKKPVVKATKRVLQIEGQKVEVRGRSAFDMLGFGAQESRQLLSEAVGEVMRRRNQVKGDLVDQLQVIADEEGMSVTEMAQRASLTRPRVSSIMNRDFEKVSIDAVVDVLHRLGKKVRFEVVDQHRATASASAASAASGEKATAGGRRPK